MSRFSGTARSSSREARGSDSSAPRHSASHGSTPTGAPDASFDGDGRAMTAFTSFSHGASALELQRDGKLVVSGNADFDRNGQSSPTGAIARYNPDGSLDGTFDDRPQDRRGRRHQGGCRLHRRSAASGRAPRRRVSGWQVRGRGLWLGLVDYPAAAALQPDGRIVV